MRGKWDFATDPNGEGRDAGWMQPGAVWPGQREIEVPGCWEAQGVGEPGTSRIWGITRDANPYPLRHIYMGAAWYRRSVAIPEAWAGKRIWLKVGGVRAQGWFWVGWGRLSWSYHSPFYALGACPSHFERTLPRVQTALAV